MRLTLEQLKAMDDEELAAAWGWGDFPFELMVCSECAFCMTHHTLGVCGASEHQAFTDAVIQILGRGFDVSIANAPKLREHLDELYALRIFYDHFYPQQHKLSKAEQTEQEKVNV